MTRSFIDFSNVESGYRSWQRADIAWQARAARGPGVSGGPKGTHTAYLYGGGFYPFGASWGGRFAPTKNCKIAPPPEPTPCVSIDPFNPCPTAPPEESPTPDPGNERQRQRRRDPSPGPDGYSRTIVAPSPPSPRSPARNVLTSGFADACSRTASRSAPVPRPWMTSTCSRPASAASSR